MEILEKQEVERAAGDFFILLIFLYIKNNIGPSS
jgi:hypothetical protein